MTDWMHENEKRNYGIKKKTGINVRGLFWALLVLIPITGALIFHLWVRSQITNTGYRIQELVEKEEALTREREKLIVKEGKLYNPERIDRVAREQLGMAPLRPDQVLPPRIPDVVPVDRSALAMMDRK
jgi:cell division protein FtsL